MKIIRNQVLKCLYSYSNNDEKLIEELNHIIDEYGQESFHIIFHVLTHLNLDKNEAKTAWKEICELRARMCELLGHNVNLRTAICDYFCSVHKSLQNPKVVEIHIFENTFNSVKYDKLTGLYNRAYFDESLVREVARAKRYDTDLSVLFIDLDDFKRVNDTYGHPAGDQVLKDVSQAIMDTIRSEDIAARYGGEEIIIILPQTQKTTGLILAERIRELVENMAFEFEDKKIPLTLSAGLASFPLDSCDAAELVKLADMALLKAKNAGKNKVLPFSTNKRRFLRVDFFTEIRAKKISIKENVHAVTANSKNLSLNGIMFESDSLFQIGSKLQLEIPFEDTNETILVIGTVVRIEFIDTERYDIGVSFLDLDDPSKTEISRFLLKKLD